MPDLVTRLKAWLGSADAQLRLAASYWSSQGRVRNAKRALYWGRRAMHGGAQEAFVFVSGVLIDSGHQSEASEGILLVWQQAAEAGQPGAQFSLGRAYERGDFGVPRDLDTALGWYTKAALAGDQDAERAVARLCSTAGSGDAGLKQLVDLGNPRDRDE